MLIIAGDLWGPLIICLLLSMYAFVFLLLTIAHCILLILVSCILAAPRRKAARTIRNRPFLRRVFLFCGSAPRWSHLMRSLLEELCTPLLSFLFFIYYFICININYFPRSLDKYSGDSYDASYTFRGFFQSVCILGYCVFPIMLAAFVCLIWANVIFRVCIVLVAIGWALTGTSLHCSPFRSC